MFYVAEAGQSYAEMEPALKDRLGHRGRAFALLAPGLKGLLG